MSTSTVARRGAPRGAAVSTRAWSAPARLMSFFSGGVGLAIKLAFLAIVNAIALWAGVILARDEKWIALIAMGLATAAIDAIYLVPRRAVPLKFLVPGTVFLLAFQVIPIFYNANVAFTNWSTGHLITKSEAVQAIETSSLAPPPNGKSYSMAPVRDAEGQLVLILVDEGTGDAFVGTSEGLEPLPADDVQVEIGLITGVEGYTLVKGGDLLGIDKALSAYTVPTQGGSAIRPEGLDVATELRPTLRYDASRDTFVRIRDGKIFRDDGSGSYVAADGDDLEPGWRTRVGFENFTRIVDDPLIRGPFLRVFAWTFAFAALTVGFAFALGLFLAIALNKPGMPLLRTYRSLLILPYAVPAFLSILVWSGLLNDEFGLVNRLLPTDVPWLFDPNWAKVSVLVVSLWLTFPYFFLVSLGALQSIPGELVEAARVDGGGPLQIFRRVTLPLLLVAVAPLLIASFAFNFNNFNIIYLLTKGGPAVGDQGVAGGTDILISYTWKLAFESGKGQDYGLASAISIVIFFIIATISATSFWRSRSLEELR
jgi:arabinogalactan oligomer/maltooligosaccharide transport system permease protein